MKKIACLFFYFFFIAALFTGCDKYENGSVLPPIQAEQADPALVKLLGEAGWETRQAAPDIVWKRQQFTNMFESRQYITLFDIDLNNPRIKVEIPYVKTGFKRTSVFANSLQADVAFNGSYFNTTTGGSSTFFK